MPSSPGKMRTKQPPPKHPRRSRFRKVCQDIWLFLGLPETWPLFPSRRKPKQPPTETALTGAWGETLAATFLRRKGYRILGRNVRFGPERELDIVARSPRFADVPPVLVFVEVKTRADETLGRPFESVDATKRRALIRAASAYLHKLHRRPVRVRFDVVEVVGRQGAPTPPLLRHIENAFTLPGNARLPV